MFPRLKRFSGNLGLQFHTVDLYDNVPIHWICQKGAEEEDGENKGGDKEEERENVQKAIFDDIGTTMCELERQGLLQLAEREVRLCQEVSAGPTFIVCI